MKRILMSTAALLLGLGACAPVLSTTPVQGGTVAISRLEGEWTGEYSSTETGRSGAIYFRLRAGADTAEGDVIMSPSQGASANVAEGRTAPTPPSGAPEPVLTIRFVAIGGDEVSGALDPYRDPQCGCALSTTFRGTLRDDVIEGTFHSEGTGIHHLPANGRWRVERSAAGK
jgi:hypothetical protein